jgi:translation elongation factor P/translation initiation factor 5A
VVLRNLACVSANAALKYTHRSKQRNPESKMQVISATKANKLQVPATEITITDKNGKKYVFVNTEGSEQYFVGETSRCVQKAQFEHGKNTLVGQGATVKEERGFYWR